MGKTVDFREVLQSSARIMTSLFNALGITKGLQRTKGSRKGISTLSELDIHLLLCPGLWVLLITGPSKGQDKNYWLSQFFGLEPNQQHLSWALRLQMVDPMTFYILACATSTLANTHNKSLVIYVLLVPFLQQSPIKET